MSTTRPAAPVVVHTKGGGLMSSSEYAANEPAADPLAPVEQAIHWLTSTTIHLALGLMVGLLAARAMRQRHLHWAWPAIVLGAIVLGRSILGASLVSILGTGALSAAVRGRRWHREDLDAGADLAALAAHRRTPPDALRAFARRVAALTRRATVERACARDGRLTVGYDRDGRAVAIPCGGASGGTHTLVAGAAGSGKTVTMTWIALCAIARGMGVIAIDPKGDRDLRWALRDSALRAGRPFVEWRPRGRTVYNPYGRGSETEIADRALAGERFTEPHYLRQAQRYMGHEVRVLREAGITVSLRTLVEHLDPARLEALLRGLPEACAQPTHDYLDSLTPRQRGDLTGVRDRLAIMAESDVGDLLDPRTEDVQPLDLLEAVRARAVVYFALQADRRPLLAQMLGAAIVQDLQAVVAIQHECPEPTLVAIDEFSAIAPERILGLFARARSAGVSMVLGTQELADLRLPGQERLLDQVLGNLSTLIAHRQTVSASTELIAGMSETKGIWRTSHHGDGGLTRTRTREQVLRPEQIRGLGQGRAAVIDLVGGGRANVAQISSPLRRR
jgi:TraM recognition site of TraD and TraG